MPIFVARQWVRHRTANINEYSLRYSEARDEFYIPDSKNIQFQSTLNKQGRSGLVPENLKNRNYGSDHLYREEFKQWIEEIWDVKDTKIDELNF